MAAATQTATSPLAAARKAHAAAQARAAQLEDELQGAEAAERELTDRLARGDTSVSAVELVAAQASGQRAALLLQGARAEVARATALTDQAGVAELVSAAISWLDDGDPVGEVARLKAIAQAAVDAAREADRAMTHTAIRFGTAFRDAGLGCANPSSGVADAVGYRGYDPKLVGPGGPILGFVVQGDRGPYVIPGAPDWSPS